MFKITLFIFYISSSLWAQNDKKFIKEFVFDNELKTENKIDKYSDYDFSDIWLLMENHNVLGIIGEDHQRIKVKFTYIQKNPHNANEYLVQGKTSVKNVVCDFLGIINIQEVYEYKKVNWGIDDEYKDKGIESEGLLIASYHFIENLDQKNSGIFEGTLYSKWYVDKNNQIQYDNIESASDSYFNNAFIGTWASNKTDVVKICNWADYRVPNANDDFDVGAGEFSPNDKYLQKGWESYKRASVYSDVRAITEELKVWWE